jgi:magnesium transporter
MIRARLDGSSVDVDRAADLNTIHPGEKQLLWVECQAPDDAEIDELAARFGIHPLAVEDIRQTNQRPKLDEYGNQLFVVLFGAVSGGDGSIGLCEVHVVIGERYIVTITAEAMPAIDSLRKQVEARAELAAGSPDMLFYRVCDSLVDSVFPLLDQLGEQIDAVEDQILQDPGRSTMGSIFALKRDLLTLRRITGPQRDLLQAFTTPRTQRIGSDAQLFLRDVYDHTVRIVEEVDSFRDLVSSALDAYLTSISNRLGEQTRRLTVVATIFLPLTFFTGFFGQNFAFLVQHISSPLAFAIGLSVMAVSVPSLLWLVSRLTRRAPPLPPELAAHRRGRLIRRRRAVRESA